MILSRQVKSISYLKAHAADIVREINDTAEPLIITQHGEAKLVVQSVEEYERTQETLALLRILAIGNRQIEEGRTVSASEAIRRVRKQQAET